MHIPHQMNNKQSTSRKPMLSKQWITLLVCFVILLLVGTFANYRQTISASSITTTKAELSPYEELSPYNKGGQANDQEKTARSTDKLATSPSIWPVNGSITSGFGWRNSPWEDGSELHPGIDIATNMGTPVVATADGEVVKSGWSGGYGNIVQINHGNGIETIYGHNSQIAVSVGQSVRKGQVISYAGSTGRSTGPHVHYEVRVNGSAVDPMKYLILY